MFVSFIVSHIKKRQPLSVANVVVAPVRSLTKDQEKRLQSAVWNDGLISVEMI